jgi:hypothetical protein
MSLGETILIANIATFGRRLMLLSSVPADLDAADLLLRSISIDQPLDLQLAQLEAKVLTEIGRGSAKGASRLIVSAGYIARVLMSEHDLDPQACKDRGDALVARLVKALAALDRLQNTPEHSGIFQHI